MTLDEIEKKYANWWEYEGTTIENVLPDIQWLISRCRELEVEVIRWKEEHKFQAALTSELLPYQERAIKAEARVKELEGAIEKHRNIVFQWHTDMFPEDEELYSVLDKTTDICE